MIGGWTFWPKAARARTLSILISIGIRRELICEERSYCQSLAGRFARFSMPVKSLLRTISSEDVLSFGILITCYQSRRIHPRTWSSHLIHRLRAAESDSTPCCGGNTIGWLGGAQLVKKLIGDVFSTSMILLLSVSKMTRYLKLFTQQFFASMPRAGSMASESTISMAWPSRTHTAAGCASAWVS